VVGKELGMWEKVMRLRPPLDVQQQSAGSGCASSAFITNRPRAASMSPTMAINAGRICQFLASLQYRASACC